MRVRARVAVALLLLPAALCTAHADETALPACRPLDLPVERWAAPPTAYRDFCARHPGECDLGGPQSLPDTPATARDLRRVSRAVNAEIRFMPDPECTGDEERWDYPDQGVGDCEDFALEKRRRLVAGGLPRGALTLAIVHHRTRGYSHTVLLAQTAGGTYVLDNLDDDVLCWNRPPFHYETRETPDGPWARFDQSGWWRDPDPARPASSTR